MTYYTPCAWCCQLAPQPKVPGTRVSCDACGHDAHSPRAVCGCDKCLAFAHRHDTPTELCLPALPALTPTE